MMLSAKDGIYGTWIDLTTGQPIRHVRWADESTGEYEQLLCSDDGRPILNGNGRPFVHRGTAKLEFLPKTLTDSLRLKALKEENAKPPASLPVEGRIKIAPGPKECEYPGCHKRAVVKTMDEEIIEPQELKSGRRFERAKAKRFHYFCSTPGHFRNPIYVSLRGVENEVKTEER